MVKEWLEMGLESWRATKDKQFKREAQTKLASGLFRGQVIGPCMTSGGSLVGT
jgi:hypothetical protein